MIDKTLIPTLAHNFSRFQAKSRDQTFIKYLLVFSCAKIFSLLPYSDFILCLMLCRIKYTVLLQYNYSLVQKILIRMVTVLLKYINLWYYF